MIRARRSVLAAPGVAAMAVLAAAAAQAASSTRIDLPRYPVCEASAALEVPCLAHPGKTCVWVGDNEQAGHLFESEVTDAGRLVESEQWKIPLDDEVGDIEAIVRDGDSILAIGSHGRNNGCEFKKKRARIARIERDPPRVKLVAGASEWQQNLTDCERWIALGDAPADAPARALRKDACATIMSAELAAEKFAAEHPGQKDCPATPLNVEGAVSLPAAGGSQRIWLGLRAPVVDGKAVLLRLAPLGGASDKRISFDGIAAIDLGGKAIRELSTGGGYLWGIAGTVLASETEQSFLWRVRDDALQNGRTIAAVEKIGDPLPPTSEGLMVSKDAKRAIILIDGGLDEAKGACDPPAGQLTVNLP